MLGPSRIVGVVREVGTKPAAKFPSGDETSGESRFFCMGNILGRTNQAIPPIEG